MKITNMFLSNSEGFLGATDSAVPCAQMLNLAHAMDRDLKEDKNRASHLSVAILTIFESMKYSQQQGDTSGCSLSLVDIKTKV